MNAPSIPAHRGATWRETALLFAVAWGLPFVTHLLPWHGAHPLGAHLLPMFWVTFIAVYFFGLRVGLLVGLFAPALNLLATGLPLPRFQMVLAAELVFYVLVLWWAVRRWPQFWLLAPLGYVAAKCGSTALQATTSLFGDIGSPGQFFTQSLSTGLAGLVVLGGINFLLVQRYPKLPAPAPDDSAGV